MPDPPLTRALLERARTAVMAGDPASAIELLMAPVRSGAPHLANELIMQSARLQRARTGLRQGVATGEAVATEDQRVGFALLQLMDDLDGVAVDEAPDPGSVDATDQAEDPDQDRDSRNAPKASADDVTPAAPEEPAPRSQVFISYSHNDKAWLERLQRMLRPLLDGGGLDVWDDTRIRPGSLWRPEIDRAMERAAVAVLLVSDDFLSSDFILNEELPYLLETARRGEVTVLWVYLSACLYERTLIGTIQAAYDPSSPLDALPPAEQNDALKTICLEIEAATHSR